VPVDEVEDGRDVIEHPSPQVAVEFDDLRALLDHDRRCGLLRVNDGVLEIIEAATGDLHRSGAPRVGRRGRVADRACITALMNSVVNATTARARTAWNEVMEASCETTSEAADSTA